ncbi:LURP-one-related/scramblase family protein [Secundilactobacillus kimchicus]|uniref:LURP-one-related/scramblase family protein n=1 Tax=Secundilactobacillus kimchicus TaxID=528209 RepID=UPI0006D106FB|nr:hypothetical protein [Secundilactobacillus kimchicus]
MRTLYIGQHSLAAKGASVIRDADHRSVYLLIGKWGRRQDALSLYQISGDLLAELRQTTLGLRLNSTFISIIKKSEPSPDTLVFLNEMIYVSSLRWLVVGNFNSGNYRIYHGTSLIMESHPAGDQRLLSVTRQEDEPVCICVAATLDHWAHRRNLVKTLFPNRWRLAPGGGTADFKGLRAHFVWDRISDRIKH